MSRNSLCFAALAVFVVSTTLVVEKADAATFSVGNTLGWTVPSGPDVYAKWASQHTFTVGDILVFNFPTGRHDVAPVPKEAFDACNSSSTLSLVTIGPANVTLSTPGQEYFICTFGQHCVAGQKLAVNVSASSSLSPSPPPSPVISPSPSTTPPPSSITAPTPVPETPSSTPPASSISPSGSPALPPSSSISLSGEPSLSPSSSISPSGSATPPSPSGPSASISPSPEGSASPGSQPSDDGIVPPPPSGGTRNDVATIFVTMIISIAVGYIF